MAEKQDQLRASYDVREIERTYRANVAVTSARPKIVRAFFAVWAALLCAGALFFLCSVGWYGVQGMFSDARLIPQVLANEAQLTKWITEYSPKSLEMGAVQTLPALLGTETTVMAEVTNPNERHGATFSFIFTFPNGETASMDSFVNPGATTVLVASSPHASRARDISLSIRDLRWQYLSREHVPNIRAWTTEHDAFSVEDVTFARDIAYDHVTVAHSTFSLVNHSPYAYWDAGFLVRIMRGKNVLALSEVHVARFRPGETRTVDLRWFGDLPATATVSIEPRIAFFDDDVYMPPEARSNSEDGRTRSTPSKR